MILQVPKRDQIHRLDAKLGGRVFESGTQRRRSIRWRFQISFPRGDGEGAQDFGTHRSQFQGFFRIRRVAEAREHRDHLWIRKAFPYDIEEFLSAAVRDVLDDD